MGSREETIAPWRSGNASAQRDAVTLISEQRPQENADRDLALEVRQAGDRPV